MESISNWTPTPLRVVTEALRLAEVSNDDLVYDLGCGDGRVVVRAAAQFGASAIGFEVDPKKVREARQRILRAGVGGCVRVRREDMLSIRDFLNATVIYLYLPQAAVNRLKPILISRCRPGTRIISVSTWLYHWKTEKELKLRVGRYTWYVGLWKIGPGLWQ